MIHGFGQQDGMEQRDPKGEATWNMMRRGQAEANQERQFSTTRFY